MKKIILAVLLLFIGENSFAQTIPTYTKPKQVKPKASSAEPNKAKTTVKKSQPASTVLFEPEMVFVEGGSFNMGSNEVTYSRTKPIHTVTISNFKMSKYEVTQAQWKVIINTNPSTFKDCNNCPVENVSYTDIQNFIEKLNLKTGKKYRLPTEAEWEFAARGGNFSKNYNYSGGSTLSKVGWTEINSEKQTHPVGELRPNELGLFDMTGNVNEWCKDWYNDTYYANSPSNNPTGPLSGSYRVVRGESWNSIAPNCLVAARRYQDPESGSAYVGFRLVSP